MKKNRSTHIDNKRLSDTIYYFAFPSDVNTADGLKDVVQFVSAVVIAWFLGALAHRFMLIGRRANVIIDDPWVTRDQGILCTDVESIVNFPIYIAYSTSWMEQSLWNAKKQQMNDTEMSV
jgi:hypothetical protein